MSALLGTEGVTLEFAPSAVDAIAKVAVQVNTSVENIGARRLQTVMERVLDDISFSASDRAGDSDRDRWRLCREAHRRSGEEPGFEPVYFVTRFSQCSSPKPFTVPLPASGERVLQRNA